MGKRYTPATAAPAKGINGRPDFNRFIVTDHEGNRVGSAIKLNTGPWVAVLADTTELVSSAAGTLDAALEYLMSVA